MSTTSKEREYNPSIVSDPPPPYREFDGQSRASSSPTVPRMASADYYGNHPMNQQQAPGAPLQQQPNGFSPPPPPPPQQQTGGYPSQQQFPQPPPPATQQYTGSPHPYPQNTHPVPPPQTHAPPPMQHQPPPPPGHNQAPYNTPGGPPLSAPGSPFPPRMQQDSPSNNGWNPVFGPHPHSKLYPPLNKPPFAGFQQFPGDKPMNPYPEGHPSTPPLNGAQTMPVGRPGPTSAGLAPPPAHPPRRYSEPPQRQDGPYELPNRPKYDDDYDSTSDDSRDGKHGGRRRRSGERRRGKKDHRNRNTFLGAGGGALIGDMIFPGLGTVGGLLLGGYAGHNASKGRSRSRSERERDRDYKDRY